MKKTHQAHWILKDIAEERSPENTINLWPKIESCMSSSAKSSAGQTMSENLKGRFSMKKSLIYAALILVIAAMAVTAFVPTVRAQMFDWVSGQSVVFSFFIPQSKVSVGLFNDGSWGFVPLSPNYLPAGDWVMVPGSYNDELSGLDTAKFTFNEGEQFVILTERKSLPNEALPNGDNVTINKQPAVLSAGLSGEVDASIPLAKNGGVQPEPSGLIKINPLRYTDGVRLTWQVGEIRLEILSNLPLKKVMRIAKSLQQVGTEPAQMIVPEH